VSVVTGKPLDRGDAAKIGRLPLLSALSEPVLGQILDATTTVEAAPGTRIFEENQIAGHIYVILDGVVGLLARVASGEHCLIQIVGPGQILGETGMFDSGRYPMTAQAIDHIRVAVIPSAPYLKEIDGNVQLRMRLLSHMSARLKTLVRQIAQLKLLNAPQRLGAFLLGLAEHRAGAETLHLNCDRKIIADMLGMTPESLSRAFRMLKSAGVRSRGRRTVVVSDIEKLREFSTPRGPHHALH
jgi:CRP/FNR family transcriptional activator FtrB